MSQEEPPNRSNFMITQSTLPNNEVRLQLYGVVPNPQLDALTVIWNLNGQRLPSGTSLSALRKLTTHISQSLKIDKPTVLHSGVYETLIYVDAYTYLHRYDCDYNNLEFVYNAVGDYTLLGKAAIRLQVRSNITTVENDSSPSCVPDSSSTQLDAGITAGVLIGGLFSGVLLIAIPTIIIW